MHEAINIMNRSLVLVPTVSTVSARLQRKPTFHEKKAKKKKTYQIRHVHWVVQRVMLKPYEDSETLRL